MCFRSAKDPSPCIIFSELYEAPPKDSAQKSEVWRTLKHRFLLRFRTIERLPPCGKRAFAAKSSQLPKTRPPPVVCLAKARGLGRKSATKVAQPRTPAASTSIDSAGNAKATRTPREHHLGLNHHCGKLSIGAVYRGLRDDHAPPHMDRYGNAGKPPWHAGAKDIGLRLDRGGPKLRRDVNPGQ